MLAVLLVGHCINQGKRCLLHAEEVGSIFRKVVCDLSGVNLHAWEMEAMWSVKPSYSSMKIEKTRRLRTETGEIQGRGNKCIYMHSLQTAFSSMLIC